MVRLTINGQTVEYHNGPANWPQLKWPAEGTSGGASLEAHSVKGETVNLTQPGEWGLFRLLEEGALKSRDATAFTMAWKFPKLPGNPEVDIDFRPARTQTPFLALGRGEHGTLLRPLRGPEVKAPSGVGSGAANCP
jgi:type VI secretion system protein ImpL